MTRSLPRLIFWVLTLGLLIRCSGGLNDSGSVPDSVTGTFR
jgi:hypothetical protein